MSPKLRSKDSKATQVYHVRDKRPSTIRRLGRFFCEIPWNLLITPESTCEQNLDSLTNIINYGLNTLAPLKTVKILKNDRPWMNSNLKSLIHKRQRAFAQNNEVLYKQLRNKVNRMRKKCRKAYYEAKIKDMKQSKPKDWWYEVKRLCGLPSGTGNNNTFSNLGQDTQNPDALANMINNAFLDPMQNYPPLDEHILSILENDAPLVVSEEDVWTCLHRIKPGKASGPDNLPNWILQKFAALLAAPIAVILNGSFKEGRLPLVWKLANVCPIPKSKQVLNVNNDLRPISLTSTLCKIAEEFVIARDLKPTLMKCIDPNQYGFISGSNTTLALISMIHRWSEAVDKTGGSVRILLTDYRKAFDLIDHNLLYEKLRKLGLKPSVFNWIVDFLCGRSQRVKLNSNCFSMWKPVKAGVPQGTKLGPWLFLVMINDLMISDDQFMGDMIKYADDTNIWEYLSCQDSTDSIKEVTNSVVDWSVCNKFELNPKKCKEMVINFQQNRPDFAPILIQGQTTVRVEKAIILGMSITQDLKWNEHVNKITKKAAKRLYLLKQLKRSGLDSKDLQCFFIVSIRTILEYACQVFHHGLPKYLSDVIERIQKRALRIILPDLSYENALATLDMKSLWLRREELCSKL